MIRNWIKNRRTTRKALRVCDGVISIAANEMLVQGTYVTEHVANQELKERGAICGGRKACLVGSMYLSHGDLPTKEEANERYGHSGFWAGIFRPPYRPEYMADRPALKLAYDAFNTAAYEIMLSEPWTREFETEEYDDDEGEYVTARIEIDVSSQHEPSEGWGEYFFEIVLKSEEDYFVRGQVIRVAENAKDLIQTGAV